MTWLVHPTDIPTPHRCDPPGERSAIRSAEHPDVIYVRSNIQDGVWRCDCGQHWLGRNTYQWWPVPAKVARRRQKRAERNIRKAEQRAHQPKESAS